MRYELSMDCGAAFWPALLRERRGARGNRRDYYAEADDPAGMHPVTQTAERRVRSGEGRERFRRLLALSEYLAQSPLPEDARSAWLELEEALHAHWLAVAIEHYNLGVEAGLQRAAIDTAAPRELPARERARALLDALRDAIEEL